jgi:methionyl-tRNA formyltransferase
MTSPLKAVLIGCVRFSRSMFDVLATLEHVEFRGVVTRSQNTINSDHADLSDVARVAQIPVFDARGQDQDAMARWIADRGADVIFCLGWSFLLKQSVLEAAQGGVIGYHPALLPRNRGRHPIIWALALGLKETGSTFFKMDTRADSGAILSQRRVAIGDDDDAAGLYAKLETVAAGQLRDLTLGLRNNSVAPVVQQESQATQWRKRDRNDGRIDWRMDATAIHNLVRALAPPYPRAHFGLGSNEVHVWKSRVGAHGARDVEPGFVLGCVGDVPHVQCGNGTTIYLEACDLTVNLSAGDYL